MFEAKPYPFALSVDALTNWPIADEPSRNPAIQYVRLAYASEIGLKTFRHPPDNELNS